MIERLAARHIQEVVQLQREALPASVLRLLGKRFLCDFYYPAFLKDPSFIGLVYLEDGKVGGFLTGTSDRPAVFGRMARQNPGLLLRTVLGSIIDSPRTIFPYFEATKFLLQNLSLRPHESSRYGEFLSTAISPSLRDRNTSGKKRNNAANALMEQGLRLMREHGCYRVVALVLRRDFFAEVFLQYHGFRFERELFFLGNHVEMFVRTME